MTKNYDINQSMGQCIISNEYNAYLVADMAIEKKNNPPTRYIDCFGIICEEANYYNGIKLLNKLRMYMRVYQYKDILYKFDSVNNRISKKLKKEDSTFLKSLYYGLLQDIVQRIERGTDLDYKLAVHLYNEAIDILLDYYGIEFNRLAPENYVYQKAGFGRLMLE